MGNAQLNLISKAKQKYGSILPCGRNSTWAHCFSAYKGKLYFWFNTDDNSTHVVMDEKGGERNECIKGNC